MATRIITAIVGITIGIIIMLLSDTIVFDIAIMALTLMIVFELLSSCNCLRYKLHSAVCFVFSAVLPLLMKAGNMTVVYVFSAVCVTVMMIGFIMTHKKLEFDKLCFMFTVSLLVTISMNCLSQLKNFDSVHGVCYVVICLAAAWLSDGAAYFVGTFFGKHKLCPEISPKKTIEGAIGGIVGGTLILVLYIFVYQLVQNSRGFEFTTNYVVALVIGVVSGLLSIVGDLTASLIKRQNDIKDFGKIMPGHGGIMDRFDSVLFVAPFLILFLNYVKLFN